jgi:hypothetical protein
MLKPQLLILRKVVFISLLLLPAWLVLSGCRREKEATATAVYDSHLAIAWFDLQLELVRETDGFTPPVAARAFGYSGVTLYEAVVPGMPGHQSLAGQLNELDSLPQPESGQLYHWPAVANSALASITRKLYPTATRENVTAINALEERLAAELAAGIPVDVWQRSVIHGRLLAEAIYVWSLTDGGNGGFAGNFPPRYTAPAGEGMWQNTPPGYMPALLPYWGSNRAMAMRSRTTCEPGPPPEYSEDPASDFYAEALEVYTTAAYLSPEQQTIALYWADDPVTTATPPGHWIAILNQMMAGPDYSLAVAAEAYAKVGIAVTDSFISCWDTKYKYGLLRPITYIQKVIDPNWNNPTLTDAVITPPFPEYTSGHSVQSGAVAWVLTDMFGDDYAFTDYTHVRLGYAPRSFPSFYAAADEAALSRLYGGIHYRTAVDRGLEQGRCIGEQVTNLRFRK